MKKTAMLLLVIGSFLLSGCTVSHFFYIRNLSEGETEITFVFDPAKTFILPDSIFIPYSPTSHLVNKNTVTYMTDSIVAKKSNLWKMTVTLPSGSMIMIDKNTSKKWKYADPTKMEVYKSNGGGSEIVYLYPNSPGDKMFKQKGKLPVIHWYDIY